MINVEEKIRKRSYLGGSFENEEKCKTRNGYWIGCSGTLIADQRVYDISDNMQSLGCRETSQCNTAGN